MTIWFSSDTHYWHKNVISYCNRPFDSVQEMNEYLIAEHNKLVQPEDTWYFLGDFAFCSKKWASEIVSRLNGKKMAIKGNHDPNLTKIGFDLCVPEMVTCIQGHVVRLCHYPRAPEDRSTNTYDLRYLDRRPPKVEGEFLLHGHSHSIKEVKLGDWSLDVGVDGNNYKPYSEYEIAHIIFKYKQDLENEKS